MNHKSRVLSATVGLAILASLACWAAQKPGPLTYRLVVSPGDITLAAKPAPDAPAAHQEESITFTGVNSSDTDYEGTAPTCQIFDVEIFWLGPSGDKLVWTWSQGKAFCQSVTPVVIPAGLNWQQTAKWDSAPAAMQPGKYRVDATFIPSNAVASANFEIHSSH
jgi:Intracellular proteinase inhibitor